MLKRVQILVSGRVQGVCFRYETREFVRTLQSITGFVRNLPDGRVEIVAEGLEPELKKLCRWARFVGSPYSRVDNTTEKWETVNRRNYKDFKITYYR